jgi:hypothetical protein
MVTKPTLMEPMDPFDAFPIEEYDAELDNWIYDKRHRCIWGHISNDKRGRFRDGTWIHTSMIPDVTEFKEGDIVKTLNSKYLLKSPQLTVDEV